MVNVKLLGLYLSSHPVSRYLKELSHYSSTRLKDLTPNRRGQISTAAGLLVATRFATTKKAIELVSQLLMTVLGV